MKYKIIIGVAFLVVLAAAPSIYFFRQYQKAQARIANPAQAAKEDAKAILAAVGKLIELPTDEEPTIATVSDVAKLKDQQFFSGAKNGDNVLIYTKAKKAILYRPSINKIIEVAPVNIGNPAPSSSPKPATASAKLKK